MSRKIYNNVVAKTHTNQFFFVLKDFGEENEKFEYNDSIRIAILEYYSLHNTIPILTLMKHINNDVNEPIISKICTSVWIVNDEIYFFIDAQEDFPYVLNLDGISIIG